MRRRPVILWLQKYASNPRQALSFFTKGGFVFAGGMMGIILSNQFMTPSLKQEIVVLFCLSITAVGGLLALWGYLCISIFKILIYILDREKNDDDSDGH